MKAAIKADKEAAKRAEKKKCAACNGIGRYDAKEALNAGRVMALG